MQLSLNDTVGVECSLGLLDVLNVQTAAAARGPAWPAHRCFCRITMLSNPLLPDCVCVSDVGLACCCAMAPGGSTSATDSRSSRSARSCWFKVHRMCGFSHALELSQACAQDLRRDRLGNGERLDRWSLEVAGCRMFAGRLPNVVRLRDRSCMEGIEIGAAFF